MQTQIHIPPFPSFFFQPVFELAFPFQPVREPNLIRAVCVCEEVGGVHISLFVRLITKGDKHKHHDVCKYRVVQILRRTLSQVLVSRTPTRRHIQTLVDHPDV